MANFDNETQDRQEPINLDDTDNEGEQEETKFDSKRKRCELCHEYKYTTSITNLSTKQKRAVEHVCSGVQCKKRQRCPTKWKTVRANFELNQFCSRNI